jgi:hypothetical protein
MKYIQVPGPIEMREPLTDKSSGESYPFAKSMRMLITGIVFNKAADTSTVFDLRRKGDRALEGQWMELTDDEWKLLETEIRRPDPKLYPVVWILSAEEHIEAIRDAVSKMPAVLAANGVSRDEAATA